MQIPSGLPRLSPVDWNARWIWSGSAPQRDARTTQVRYFRRTFEVIDDEGSLRVHVSADSRYRLFVNGRSVAFGPCKGHRFEHYYETCDLTPYLAEGKNVLAAKVVHYPNVMPVEPARCGPNAVSRATSGAFILEGTLTDRAGVPLLSLDTDTNWSVLVDEAISAGSQRRSIWIGSPEIVDGSRLPIGWQHLEYDDSDWEQAVVLEWLHGEVWANGVSPNGFHYGELTPWPLYPRPIPFLYEERKAFTRVVRASSASFAELLSDGRVVIEPHSAESVELDAGSLTTGFIELAVDGGLGSRVSILSSECYERHEQPRKAVRDDPSHGQLMGDVDTYLPSGRKEIHEPFWFRTFRFVRISVETDREPLLLESLAYRETGYPLRVDADFECSDPDFARLWEISLRTLRCCMHETYEDCPFYEQLQYGMDTRLQALFTYYTSSDDRLARKAIHDFHCSLMPDGLLQSRSPSHQPQVIPTFSLHWIGMVAEHYRHFGDLSLVSRYLSTIDSIVAWFARHTGDTGLVQDTGYWSFVDWVSEWRYGVPDSARVGPDAISTLMFSASLADAAWLSRAVGRRCMAEEYRRLALRLNEAVSESCWDQYIGLFSDGPGLEQFSQHTQVWAVLAGAVTGDAARRVMEACISRTEISRCSYAMSFFLFRALQAVKLYDRVFEMWDVYRHLAGLNLTTWPEDPVSQRSDCHGWSSTPLYEFPAVVLGVTAGRPGWAEIIVSPHPGPLRWARGRVPTAVGNVDVKWDVGDGGEGMHIEVDAPSGVPTLVRFPSGNEITLSDGGRYVGRGYAQRGACILKGVGDQRDTR